jgi:hypothetical protein
MKLKAFLLGLDDLREEEIISPNNCILGKWINEYGWEAYKGYPEMKEFVDLHNEVHNIVSEIPSLKKNNKLEKANERYRELEKESDKLINILERIQKKEEAKETLDNDQPEKESAENQQEKYKENPGEEDKQQAQ